MGEKEEKKGRVGNFICNEKKKKKKEPKREIERKNFHLLSIVIG
jgi:hypothetical protein